MYHALVVSAALFVGQTAVPATPSAQVMPPMVVRGPQIQTVSHEVFTGSTASCSTCAQGECKITLFKCWTADALKMEPVDHNKACATCGCGGFLSNLIWCPKAPDKADDKKDDSKKDDSAKDDKKDDKKDEAKKDDAPAAPDLNVEMQALKCYLPSIYDCLDKKGIKAYGWLQQGYTENFSSPHDRANVGLSFNSRSNAYLLNQLNFVLEKTLDLDKKKDELHFGGRIDFMFGTDAPAIASVSPGLAQNVADYRFGGDVYGIEVPQFYIDTHLPILTDRGFDVRVGRFYTNMGYEVTPGTATDFYSHSYDYFYAIPFTHTGVMTTLHIGDNLDVMNGFVRGWDDVFTDVNDTGSYMGGMIWTSCDKNNIVAINYGTGPEQAGNNHDYRSIVTAYYTKKFGDVNQWRFVTGGTLAVDNNAVTNANGVKHDANWYDYGTYLFYTVDPRLILGVRGEWFRDEDGYRGVNPSGLGDSYYELTLGATWKAYQNLRVRPELRFDTASHNRPYNDQTDRFQTTAAVDVIWDF